MLQSSIHITSTMAYKNNKDEYIYQKFLGNINEEPSQSSTQDDEDDPDYNFNSDFRTHLWSDSWLYQQSKVPESERSQLNDAFNNKQFITILDQQLRQHVQLLTQTYLMTRDTSMHHVANIMKDHLHKIDTVFYNKTKPVNLMPALMLTKDYPLNSDGKLSIRSCWRGIKLPQDIKQVIYSNPSIFLYPSLLPRVAFSTLRLPDSIVNKKPPHSIFTDNEKNLFAYALEYEFKEDKKRFDKISEFLMEAKTPYQLRNHVKNLKRNFDKIKSNNPLEEYLREGKLPTIEHKIEIAVTQYNEPHESYPDWMNEEIKLRTRPIDIKCDPIKREPDEISYSHDANSPVIPLTVVPTQSNSSSAPSFDSFASQSQQFHHPSQHQHHQPQQQQHLQHHHPHHHHHHQCTGNDAFLSTAANYEDESRQAIVALTESNDHDMTNTLISDNPSRIDGLDLDFGDNATDFMSFLETNANNPINNNNIDMLFEDGLDCYDGENIEDIVMDTDVNVDEEEEDVEEEDEVDDDDDVDVVVGNEEDIIDDVDDVCKVDGEDKDYFSPVSGDLEADAETALCLNEDAMDNCDAYEPMDIGDNAIDLEALMAASTTIAKKQSTILANQSALNGGVKSSTLSDGDNTQQLNKRELRAKKMQTSMINLMSQDMVGDGVKHSAVMFHLNHMEDLLKSYYIKQCELCLPNDDYVHFLQLLSELKDTTCDEQKSSADNTSELSQQNTQGHHTEAQKQEMIEISANDDDKIETRNVVSTYYQILDFFHKINAPVELKDLLVLFLDLEQAIQCGCTINYLYWMKFLQFMKYVELYSDGDETITNKIYRCALAASKQKAISPDGIPNESVNGSDKAQNCHQSVAAQPYMGHINTYYALDSNDRQKLRATMTRALNGHPLLMREFNFLFLDERPHLSYFNCEDDFDDITTVLEKEGDVSEGELDFEHFKLLVTKEELKYGSSNCQCKCHCSNRSIKLTASHTVGNNQPVGIDNNDGVTNNSAVPSNQTKISIGRHCGHCNLKFINRKIYLVNQVKPVLAGYTYVKNDDSFNSSDCNSPEKREMFNNRSEYEQCDSSEKLANMVSKLVGSPHSPTKVIKKPGPTSAWTYEEDKALLEFCRSKVLTCDQNDDSVSLNTEMFDELVANQLHGRKSSDQVAKRFNQLVELYKQNATVLDCS